MQNDVTYGAHDEHLEVVGRGRIVPSESSGLMVALSVVEEVRVSSLAAAMRRFEHYVAPGPTDIELKNIEPGRQIRDWSPGLEADLRFEDGRFLVQAVAFSEEEPKRSDIGRILKPIMRRYRAKVIECAVYDNSVDDGWVIHLTIRVPTRNKRVGEIVEAGVDASVALTSAFYSHSPEVSRHSAADLVRAGSYELLVGHFENDWLEAKGAPYRMQTDEGRFELVKDVASLANAGGGLIVLGAQTKKRPEGDEIRSVRGCRPEDLDPKTYQRTLRRRIYPELLDVGLELVPGPAPNRVIGLLEVPANPDSLKPHLVIGTDDSGLGFTWARRSGDGTGGPKVETLHALIRAGEYVLAARDADQQVAELQAELDSLSDSSLPLFLQGIPEAARAAGFRVRRNGGELRFTRSGAEPMIVALEAISPPADIGLREKVLRELADRGLPVSQTSRGFLSPDWTQVLDSQAPAHPES